ncbi:MAG: ABC transporter ATP-binding protein [Chthonomonas sp.]|nr:ABC transporter ATP-binding protein [Chthonomonas sp.]
MAVLEVENLSLAIGGMPILRGVSFQVEAGQTLGVVGESGCGKSMTAKAIIGMAPPGSAVSGSIRLAGQELVSSPEKSWQQIRGKQIAMVMQDPFTSLNPVLNVGSQIAEVFELHQNSTRRQAWTQAVDMLDRVGIPDPAASARKFPHQMSGGQRQRVVIAIGFACRPQVLLADEPTTALDVTLQAQVLRLLKDLQTECGTAVLLISHDIGVIAETSDELAVFYAGQVVEQGPPTMLRAPQHPYTQALLGAVPQPGRDRLASISGQPPRFDALPPGCAFAPRCPYKVPECDQPQPLRQLAEGIAVRCLRINGAPMASSPLEK